jgi:hypothetical protein
MKLLSLIIISVILGYILFMMGPIVGGFIAFGIVQGCIFRGLYLLNDIHKRLFGDLPKRDKVKQAYENYLLERDNENQ